MMRSEGIGGLLVKFASYLGALGGTSNYSSNVRDLGSQITVTNIEYDHKQKVKYCENHQNVTEALSE